MAIKKENASDASAQTYTKQQFLSAQRFSDKKDILNAVLVDDQLYTMEQVETLLADFMKKEVS